MAAVRNHHTRGEAHRLNSKRVHEEASVGFAANRKRPGARVQQTVGIGKLAKFGVVQLCVRQGKRVSRILTLNLYNRR